MQALLLTWKRSSGQPIRKLLSTAGTLSGTKEMDTQILTEREKIGKKCLENIYQP